MQLNIPITNSNLINPKSVFNVMTILSVSWRWTLTLVEGKLHKRLSLRTGPRM